MIHYSSEHVWVRAADGVAVIGITDHAQAALGDITFIDLKKVGTVVEQGGSLGVLESVKTASELVAPVSGRIKRVNPDAVKAPERINADPLGAGWICEVTPSAPEQVDALMDEEAYQRFLKSM